MQFWNIRKQNSYKDGQRVPEIWRSAIIKLAEQQDGAVAFVEINPEVQVMAFSRFVHLPMANLKEEFVHLKNMCQSMPLFI